MLMSLLRGVGLIFVYLLPFTPKVAYRYTIKNKGIQGDWERIGGDLERALQSPNQTYKRKERAHETT